MDKKSDSGRGSETMADRTSLDIEGENRKPHLRQNGTIPRAGQAVSNSASRSCGTRDCQKKLNLSKGSVD